MDLKDKENVDKLYARILEIGEFTKAELNEFKEFPIFSVNTFKSKDYQRLYKISVCSPDPNYKRMEEDMKDPYKVLKDINK